MKRAFRFILFLVIAFIAITLIAKAQMRCVSIIVGQWFVYTFPTVQTGNFEATFDATPGGAAISMDMGLAQTNTQSFQSLGVTVRFNGQNFIDAINGASWGSAVATPYTPGQLYHFVIDVNMTTQTYTATVQAGSGRIVPLATNYAFRSTAGHAASLGYFMVQNNQGTGTSSVCLFKLGAYQPPHQAKLTWKASVVDATHPAATSYIVMKGSPTPNLQIAKLPASVLGYTDVNVAAGHKPCYAIVAQNAGGNSPPTATQCVTIP